MSHSVPLQLESFLPYRLSVLSNIVSTAIASAYRDRFGLSIPEWRVIAVLAQTTHLSAAQVAERTAMDKVAVSRAVRSLLARRRLRRRIARADRRRSVLQLTAAGRHVHSQVAPFALGYEHALLQPLTREERELLDRALRILLGRAMEMGPARP